jgi:hypothetical protein
VFKLENLSEDMEKRLPSTEALLTYAAEIWFHPLLELTIYLSVVKDIKSFRDRRSGHSMIRQWRGKESDKEKISEFRTRLNRIIQQFGVSFCVGHVIDSGSLISSDLDRGVVLSYEECRRYHHRLT